MSETPIRAARFRPKARMAKILGEQLIRDNTVGLMELIKNSYDADATHVTVELRGLGSREGTTIIVCDDGTGMTESDIRGPWFEPANASKESQKTDGTRTVKGRLPLGEKGVGRFAAQKLGRTLELVTRPAGSELEHVVRVNWDAYDDDTLYMDEVEVPIAARPPEVFLDKEHGTCLIMRGAREPWRRDDLQRFQASLIRLVSPRSGVEEFDVTFVCPEFPELESLDRHDTLDRYQYRIDCIVDDDGIAQYEYRQRQPDGTEVLVEEEQNLWAQTHPDDWTERRPACGALCVQMSAWLLKADLLREYGLNRDQLKVLGGVSIYRDGFRVLPYGDEGDDWLGLDQRRINVPAARLGNRQIIGIVELNQDANQDLIDKTNREGLQENQAYFDLKALVLGVLQILERHSLEQRQSVKHQSTPKVELESRIKDLEETIQRITGETDGDPQAAATDTVKADDPQETPLPPQGMVLVQADELRQLEEQASVIRESVAEIHEEQEHERETFLHLLGVGLASERFAHEFDRLVDRSSKCVQSLKFAGVGDEDSLRQLDTAINTLRNEIRLMGALRYVRRSQKAKDVSVRETVELVLVGHDERLRSNGIRLDCKLSDDFSVYISQASLAQIIDNIVDNSVYWLQQKMEKDDRELRVVLSATDKSIVISNNGPGVNPSVKSRLFRVPFVSDKHEGRGVGMYIAGEIVRRAGGAITLASSEDVRALDGAGFVVTLPSGSTQ